MTAFIKHAQEIQIHRELVPIDTQRLVDAWRLNRSPKTLKAYDFDLQKFADFTGDGSPGFAASRLIANGAGRANELVERYKAFMREKHLSSATINRRLSALRSVVEIGRKIGMIAWSLTVDGVKSERRRDVRGPAKEAVDRMIEIARKQVGSRASRDVALIRLMFNRGLRRESVAAMFYEDVDLEKLEIRVSLKGYSEKVIMSIPPQVANDLKAWMYIRGTAIRGTGPSLFNLAGGSIWRIVKRIGAKAGIKCWPHALRHSAATEGYKRTKDLSAVQSFLKHANPTTTARYIDELEDRGGDVARAIMDE